MVLYIDACPRKESRTRQLAEYLLQKMGAHETIVLADSQIADVDDAFLKRRSQDVAQRHFEDPCYRFAKQFVEADEIVIAAPFWDLSFPAILKRYIELICIPGIAFRYQTDGTVLGLCKAKKLYYITTAGGPIPNSEYGYGYIRMLGETLFGIEEYRFLAVENLDIPSYNVEELLQDAREQIDCMMK